MAEVTLDEVYDQPLFRDLLDAAGITAQYLIKKLKKELNADVTKTIKLKGAVTKSELPRGYKAVVTSGQIITLRSKDGFEEDYGDGETIVAWNETDWATRQKARMDAHKLRGDYAPEKKELTGKDGGPIQWAAAPETASSIADWEAQVAEAQKKRKEREDADKANT